MDSNIQYTQADILVAAIDHIERFTKPNRNFLNIEGLLLDFCIELLMFMKPNTVLMIYAMGSPFFDLKELHFLPLLSVGRSGSMKFIEVDLFHVDYFLYKLNPGFEYIGECFLYLIFIKNQIYFFYIKDDSKLISFKNIFEDNENYKVLDVVKYFQGLKV